jgi:hypothetical protein
MMLHKFAQGGSPSAALVVASVIPNPEHKLLDQMREVIRVKLHHTYEKLIPCHLTPRREDLFHKIWPPNGKFTFLTTLIYG